jgi:Flp pilus assembly protein TadG
VELALILPVLLTILGASVDIARIYGAWVALEGATRDAAEQVATFEGTTSNTTIASAHAQSVVCSEMVKITGFVAPAGNPTSCTQPAVTLSSWTVSTTPALGGSSRNPVGKATVTATLPVPVFIVMTMGVVDVGRVIWATTSLNAAAREGARYAIVHGGSTSDPCPVGPAGPDSNPNPVASCVYPSPSKQYIYDAANASTIAGGSNITVTACYGAGCTGNADTLDNRRGTPVTVTITSQINLITPAFVGITSFTVSGTSTMVVNH